MHIDVLVGQLARLEKRRQNVSELDKAVSSRLTKLPTALGFRDMDSLIAALIPHASQGFTARVNSEGSEPTPKAANGAAKRASGRKRAHFTPELKGRIKAELEAGNKSVAVLSREYGPSHPTIMSWKREWGMTKPRAKRKAKSAK